MKTQKKTVIFRAALLVLCLIVTVSSSAFGDTITANDDCTTRGSTNYNANYPFGLFVKNSDDVGWVEFTIGTGAVSDATLDIYQAWASVPGSWTILIKGYVYNFTESTFTGTSTASWTTVGTIPNVSSVTSYSLDITDFYNNNLGNTVTFWLSRSTQPAGDGPIFEDKEGTLTGNGAVNGPKIT